MVSDADCLDEIVRSPLTAPLAGLMQYSSQLDSKASILWFVEPPSGERFVLKAPRGDRTESSFFSKLAQLDRCRLRRERWPELVIPVLVHGAQRPCTAQPLVIGRSLLTETRWRVRPAVDRLFDSVFAIVSAVADVDIGSSDDWKPKSTWAQSCPDQSTRPYRTGLVHNDLVPVNIIRTKDGKIRLIDWDEMDFAPSIFNLYEGTLALGSLLVAGFARRRSIEEYADVFGAIRKGRFASLQRPFAALYERLQPRSSGIGPAESFNAFLAYKSRLTGGARDERWGKLLIHSHRMIDDLEEITCHTNV